MLVIEKLQSSFPAAEHVPSGNVKKEYDIRSVVARRLGPGLTCILRGRTHTAVLKVFRTAISPFDL